MYCSADYKVLVRKYYFFSIQILLLCLLLVSSYTYLPSLSSAKNTYYLPKASILIDDGSSTGSHNIVNNNNIIRTQHQKMRQQRRPPHYSLWLLPPNPDREFLREHIHTLSSSREGSGAPFEAHVTMVGSIPMTDDAIDNEEIEMKIISNAVNVLRDGLKNFGHVECRFFADDTTKQQKSQLPLSFMIDSNTGVPIWNQAAVFVMEETDDFMKLCVRARSLLGMQSDVNQWGFAPPIKKPHLSLYYGIHNVPTEDEILVLLNNNDASTSSSSSDSSSSSSSNSSFVENKKFHANQIAIWKTDPPITDGVAQWKEIAVIDLVQEEE